MPPEDGADLARQMNNPGQNGFPPHPAGDTLAEKAARDAAMMQGGRHVSWRGIEEFLAVVETGSFTAGAEALGVSKSYVSKIVSELEARVGAQLLLRTTRRLSLTTAGDLFYQRCQEMRSALADVERQVAQFQERPVGRLRIGLSDIFGVTFMSSIVADFSSRHREIAVEVVASLREADLVQEQFDVVIRYGKLGDSGLKARLVGYLSYCLTTTPAYLEHRGWPENMAALADHDCLTDLSGHFHFNAGGGPERLRVSGPWKSNSGLALVSAVRHGLGIAQLPISIIREELMSGRLVALDREWAFYDREVWAVFSPGMIPVATRAFIDHLAASFGRGKLRPWMRPAMRALSDVIRPGERDG